MKNLLTIASITTTVVSGLLPQFQSVDVRNPHTGEVKNRIEIPARAVEVAPDVFYLGQTVEKGQVLEGYMYIHRKDNFVKPGTECGNGVCEIGENAKKCPADCSDTPVPEDSTCYGFLSKGAMWKAEENYLFNPMNSRGMSEILLVDLLANDIATWETAAEKFNIVGTGFYTRESLVADTVSTDGKNEVYFADIDSPGAIGITITWGIFGGAPKNRQLVEWDQVYDDVDFDWSTDGAADKMDFENIATHEIGHAIGMNDLYTNDCSQETMYGYASEGELNKRTLEIGDITGIKLLYK